MIGQKNIIEWVNANIDTLPHFLVFVGAKGSGKRTLAKYIAEKLGAVYSEIGIKADDVREVVDTASLSASKVLYCFADADTMKPAAKNAMLKITEEAPENAYFVLTVENESTLLDTIKSRAFVTTMEDYSMDELLEYAHEKNYSVKNISMASTPYEVDMLYAYGEDFINYVNLVIDNIAEVEPANAFKSSAKLAIKNEEGYDLKFFFTALNYIMVHRLLWGSCDKKKYAKATLATNKARKKLSDISANKQQVYDSWVFEIREALI